MNIFDKLYDGEIIPAETAVPNTESYQEKIRQKDFVMEELKKEVPSHLLPLLEKLRSLYLSISEEECQCTYAEGVRFGVELMMEIHHMDEKRSLILPQINE